MTGRFTPLIPFLFLGKILLAQPSFGGTPPGLLPENQAVVSQKRLAPVAIAAPDLARVQAEDDQLPIQERFAVPVAVDVSPENSGAWLDLPDGSRLWRCQLTAAGAKGLVVLFDQFQLPAGGQFFAYDLAKKYVEGAFTQRSCLPSGQFLLGPLPGETAILEYWEPRMARGLAKIHVHRIDWGYHPDVNAQVAGLLDFGSALACHTNIICQVAGNFFAEKRGVARILMVFGNGSGWCSGTAVANTSGTDVPYFLTAHHCQILLANPEFSLWRFDFNYESLTCTNPVSEPSRQSVLGCERVAFRAETDFMLLKLNPIPANYQVWFNGWDRNPNPPVSTVLIHHPRGDIKKYTADSKPASIFDQPINWGTGFGTSPANTHFKTAPETGTFEPGSSGCPLFDENRRVVGQLHGGNVLVNPCYVKETYFGMFGLSWNSGTSAASRIKDWLDPTNLNPTMQDGYLQPVPPPPPPHSISGKISTFWGQNMANVRVNLTGGTVRTAFTDANGIFKFDSLPINNDYYIRPVRDTNDLNGVSTYDLLNMSKHILGIVPLDSPWKLLASDQNLSNSVTTFDVLQYQKSILGIYPNGFPDAPSWRFFPASTQFADPATPWPAPEQFLLVTNLQADVTGVNFVGVKMGDTNQSAKPGE